MTDDRRLEQWLRRLGWSLGRLPPAERDDIVRETRTHMEDRCASGRPLAAVLADFGPADRYARQFVDEMETCEALGSQRAGDLARVVTRRADRDLIAAGTLFVLLALGIAAALTVLLTGLKLYDPVHTGVWAGRNFFVVGVIDDPRTARELLGFWLYPTAAFFLLFSWIAARSLLSFAVPRLLPRDYNSINGSDHHGS